MRWCLRHCDFVPVEIPLRGSSLELEVANHKRDAITFAAVHTLSSPIRKQFSTIVTRTLC